MYSHWSEWNFLPESCFGEVPGGCRWQELSLPGSYLELFPDGYSEQVSGYYFGEVPGVEEPETDDDRAIEGMEGETAYDCHSNLLEPVKLFDCKTKFKSLSCYKNVSIS